MKKILLASVALTAFAGAAAAEVNFAGDAELGYNDDIEDGVYYSVGLTVKASAELDNGITAAASLDVDISEQDTFGGGSVDTSDYVLSVSSENATLKFGDVAVAADAHWAGVTNMEADPFNEAEDNGEDGVLYGEVTFGSVTAAVSYNVNDVTNSTDELDAMQFAMVADLGDFSVVAAYQDEDNTAGEVTAVAVSGSFAGADVTVAYADEANVETSTGLEISYPMGAVTATVFYVDNSVSDDNSGLKLAYAEGPLSVTAWVHDGADEDQGIDVSYDMGNGLNLFAGDSEDDGTYVAAEYDLGGGAALLVSYGDDDANDEIGPNEYNDGTTVAVSFAF
jgi:hypothetical protein